MNGRWLAGCGHASCAQTRAHALASSNRSARRARDTSQLRRASSRPRAPESLDDISSPKSPGDMYPGDFTYIIFFAKLCTRSGDGASVPTTAGPDPTSTAPPTLLSAGARGLRWGPSSTFHPPGGTLLPLLVEEPDCHRIGVAVSIFKCGWGLQPNITMTVFATKLMRKWT